jgi:choline dehydrogenase-like flavoprotein
MLIAFSELDELPCSDVCVVGAGPVGIALALECVRHGLSVLMLESGYEHPDKWATALSAGHSVSSTHAPTELAICRGLGGTSRWWGGRCVPFDDIDFATRPHLPAAAWPFPHDEISRWYPAAAGFFGVEPSRFEMPAMTSTDIGDIRFDRLERWAADLNAGQRHRSQLARSPTIKVVLGATVTAIDLDDGGRRVVRLSVSDPSKTLPCRPVRLVLACGGLETTRLLLAMQRKWRDALGGQNGPLGRRYMGHISGKIANLVLADGDAAQSHDFFLDGGVFARRRFTILPEVQLREQLLNIAFWSDNPPFHAASHRNGVLSLVWLALAFGPVGRRLVAEAVRVSHVGHRPYHWMRHAGNIMGAPLSTVRDIAAILHGRLLARPRKPGFLLRSSDCRYALHYHGEQAPNDESRVTLSDDKDALGMPLLRIDLRYSDIDTRSVAAAHVLLDQSWRGGGLGDLQFVEADAAARIASISRQARDGFHQIGTTRMGHSPQHSVVDAQCRAHGIDNLFVASSSVFPSSGQANPTFATVALAHRLAGHLVAEANCRLEAA